jgi:hypothetical protein
MTYALEQVPKRISFPLNPIVGDVVRLTRQRESSPIEPLPRRGSAAFSGLDYLPTGELITKPPETQRITTDIWTGFIAVAMSCMVHYQSLDSARVASQAKTSPYEHETYGPSLSGNVAPAISLINEAQSYSGLNLDMIAPLLGVSRRSIQYWKDEKKISQKNELLLRDLVDALKQISLGKPDHTRDVLLARVTGVPRIYDLLVERRYDKAIARAKNKAQSEPILSDPTLKFNSRPIADQVAFADDGPAKPMGKLNRSVSRRIVR